MSKLGVNLVFVFIFAFTFGILVSSFINFSPLISVFLIVMGLGALLVEKIWNKEISPSALFLILAIIAVALGGLRYEVKDFQTGDLDLKKQVGQRITLVGVVSDEPEKRDSDTRIVVNTGADKILVTTSMYGEAQYGDRVEVKGVLKIPKVIDTSRASGQENGRKFDYGKFLSKDDIYYTVSFAEVSVLNQGEGNKLKSLLLSIKNSLVGKMREMLPEPESSLLAGLIVAGKDALPKDITEEFRRAGIVHIVVLSGYNITIIAEFIRRIFRFLTPKKAAVATLLSIVLFVLMTGAGATIVRAALMAMIAIGGKMFGRTYSAPRALLLAGFVMLLINPKILVFDASFQLSFLATLALIYVVPVTDKYLERIPEKWGMRTLVSTTIATQILVVPFLLYNMGNVSVISLVTNILVLPVIPFTMLIGFVATLLSFISSLIALPLSYLTHLLLSWILAVAEYLGNLPFAQVEIDNFPLWGTLLLYGVIVIVLWRNSLQRFASSDSRRKLPHT